MTLVALLAAKGAPGVSTCATALLLAWPEATGREVLLVDADVSGAGAASAYQRHGFGDGRGLLGWVGAGGRSTLEEQLYRVDAAGSRWLLPGLPDPTAAPAVARRWPELLEAVEKTCAGRDLDVLVDLGRWGSRHEASPLRTAADLVVLVLRSGFESVTFTQAVRSLLAETPGQCVAALLVGEREPYDRREVQKAIGVDVVGVLPIDARGARRLTDARSLESVALRSPMARAARAAAERLHQLAEEIRHD